MITCTKVDFSDPKQGQLVVQLLDAYASDPMGGAEGLKETTKRNLATELAKRSFAHVFIGYIDGSPAGLAICFEAFSTFECKPLLNIHDFVVLPAFRRQGIGSSMMFYIEQYAKSLDCCKLTLEVLSGNHPAKATYKAVGFEPYELDPSAGCAEFWQKKIIY